MSMQINAGWAVPEMESIVENLIDLWKSGGTLAQAMGLCGEECEALYAYGYALYAQAKYGDAVKIFTRLVALDHLDSRYQMALASAMQMTGRYEAALEQYVIATLLRVDDPAPVFHCAECLIALGRLEDARVSLNLVVESLCKAGEHDVIKARALALLGGLRLGAAGH